MYVGSTAERYPDRPAVVLVEPDEVVTYRELDERSNQAAHGLRSLGVGVGDAIAVMLENEAVWFEVWWGAMRAGAYLTPVNWHLVPDEVDYILRNSGAKVLFVGRGLVGPIERTVSTIADLAVVVVGDGYEDLVRGRPITPLAEEVAGSPMFYSSGTTGRPKGIRIPIDGSPPTEADSRMRFVARNYGFQPGDRYLCTGPLYHAAPAIWSTAMHTVGGTAYVLRRFDAATSLRTIERFRISHSQWVPTMFHRLLALPDEVRTAYDLTSHREAWHAAAPCPVELKRRMIDWWGPIVHEYYSGSEGGGTAIRCDEWLRHPGSVGRPWAGRSIHVLDPVTGDELPPGEDGVVFFRVPSAYDFVYHDDPIRTAEAHHGGLVTLGDVGHVDGDGYLFLTGRRSDLIISGGVNIYPREIEDVLSMHPAVRDVAVFGVPDEEYGERVVAVVEPESGAEVDVADLLSHCRQHLATFKCPRRVEVVQRVPRDPNGKLYTRYVARGLG